MALDSEGDDVDEDMAENKGVNEFGVIPFVYINKSRSLLVPIPDKDDYAMSVLVPVLLTDLNFAAKFLAHSIFYGIDLDADNLKLSPDAVWIFKSDKEEGTKPEVGTIKPEVSITDVISLIKEQLIAWLDTKNVRTKAAGNIDANDAASGVSKIIDEADTTIDRKQQIRIFRAAELEYWRKLATIHNKTATAKVIKNTALFKDPETLRVDVDYSEQQIVEPRSVVVVSLEKEVNAGFKSKKRAIKELNPRASEEEIEEMMAEIADERVIIIPENEDNVDGEPVDE